MIFLEHRTVHGYRLRFEWHGGEYIDIAFKGTTGGFDCINVWDAGADVPTIPRTREGFLSAVQEWIDDPERDLLSDLDEYAYGRGT